MKQFRWFWFPHEVLNEIWALDQLSKTVSLVFCAVFSHRLSYGRRPSNQNSNDSKAKEKKEEPNFKLSGKLTEYTNTYNVSSKTFLWTSTCTKSTVKTLALDNYCFSVFIADFQLLLPTGFSLPVLLKW